MVQSAIRDPHVHHHESSYLWFLLLFFVSDFCTLYKFCRVCEGMGVLQNSQKVSGTGMDLLQNFQKFRVLWHRYSLQNSRKFRAGTKHAVPVPRVLWHRSYKTHRSSRNGCESLNELPQVPGTGMKVLQNFQNFRVLWHTDVQNFQKFRAGTNTLYPYPGSLWHRRTELQLTARSSGYGYECPTEVTEVICRVIPGVNTRVWFCVYPTDRTKIENSGTGMNVVHN